MDDALMTLPPGIRRRGDSLLIDYRACGKRVRRAVRDMPADEAIALRNRLVAEAERLNPWQGPAKRALVSEVRGMPWADPGKWLGPYLTKTRKNANARGIEFNLSTEDALRLLIETGGKCSMTSIPFNAEKREGWRMAPFRPSLDRIDSRVGYSAGNCRWICAAMNVALNDLGEDVFRRMAVGYVSRVLTML